MVARKRTKWRFHCSTCGAAFEVPQTWAYCSKDCERERAGFGDAPPMPGYFVERHLDLARKLEVAMPWERGDLLAAMAQLREEGARVAADQAVHSTFEAPAGAPTQDQPAFWSGILRRDAEKFEQVGRRWLKVALTLGRRLVSARRSMPRGEFGRMFIDHPNPVDNALPFSARWGRMLMRISSHGVTGSRKSTSALPAEVMTVYELSLAPETAVEEALARGDVHPAMTIEDARKIREGR